MLHFAYDRITRPAYVAQCQSDRGLCIRLSLLANSHKLQRLLVGVSEHGRGTFALGATLIPFDRNNTSS